MKETHIINNSKIKFNEGKNDSVSISCSNKIVKMTNESKGD